jgi:hypothetical protein
MVRPDIKSDECPPPGIVPPVVQFMSPRLKSPPKNILAFLYLLSLLIFESDFPNFCIAFSSSSIKYTGKTGKNSLTKTMEVYS